MVATAVAAVEDDSSTDEAEVAPLDPETIAFLKTCSASVLSQQLLDHRFSNRHSEASTFLKETYRHAEQAALQVAMTQPMDDSFDCDNNDSDNNNNNKNKNNNTSSQMLLSEPLDTSLLTPRMGRVQIQLSANGLLATRLKISNVSQQPSVHLKPGQVSHLIVFPKPEDCKLIKSGIGSKNSSKVKGHVVLLKLKAPILFQGKEMDHFCFSLPWDKKEGCTGPKLADLDDEEEDDEEEDDDEEEVEYGNGNQSITPTPAWKMATDGWRKVLTQALQKPAATTVPGDANTKMSMKVVQVRVNCTAFYSHIDIGTSTTTSGMPFVSCNRGVQDGVLYPLKQGLLFFKPPRFLPVEDMQRVMFGRGASAGQSSSRYIDLAIMLRPREQAEDENGNEQNSNNKKATNSAMVPKGEIEEFSNIPCQEEKALDDYKKEYIVPYLQKSTSGTAENNGDVEDDDEIEVQAEAVDTDDDTDQGDEDFHENDTSSEGEGDRDETDDEEGGIPVVRDEWLEELRKIPEEKKRKMMDEDDSDSETHGTDGSDEDDSPKRKKIRKSKRLASPKTKEESYLFD
ncbi:unnamed protein product [Cylindrotheca closterium]|uniref:Histone chaperone RTT106/FACT complex subunit SPT16-like middle domain-containing protein n=1 Tax=Cylindrotheca closterium TaxID=2856 RepID=A0AAD2PUR2_9STRA|nr:unnamed protein product [Cylindrotheca closterium]